MNLSGKVSPVNEKDFTPTKVKASVNLPSKPVKPKSFRDFSPSVLSIYIVPL